MAYIDKAGFRCSGLSFEQYMGGSQAYLETMPVEARSTPACLSCNLLLSSFQGKEQSTTVSGRVWCPAFRPSVLVLNGLHMLLHGVTRRLSPKTASMIKRCAAPNTRLVVAIVVGIPFVIPF